MKKFFLIVFAALLCVTAFAQRKGGEATGKLVGKHSGTPLEYVSVTLRDAASHKVINGAMTDSAGLFRIDNIKYGTYVLQCSYVGCADYLTPSFKINSENLSERFNAIVIDDSGLYLGGAVVTAKQSTYIQSIDKKIFNVGSDIASASGAVSDLLQNVPSVQVDLEGNVSLRGNDNVQVLINGKPSVLMRGANRGTVLQQLPASSIERIEVITNPSAQYKPDGTSGIINLIMKKEHSQGLNGSVVGNVGNKGRYNVGVTLGWNTPKFGVTANYGYRADRRDRTTKNDRTITDENTGAKTVVSQYNDSRARSHSQIGGLGVQWNPNKKDSFGASGSYTYMTFPRYEANKTVQGDGTKIDQQYIRYRYDSEWQKEAESNASYTHTFREDRTLLLDYTYSLSDELERNTYTNSYTLPTISETKDRMKIRQTDYENLIRLIYTDKIDDHNKLVTGYEAELDRAIMRYNADDLVGADWVKNTQRSNDYLFYENVHSIYSTWEHSFDKFAFMAGIRGEQSFITSNLVTLDQIVHDNYFLLYPTLHTTYKLNDNNELQLNYSLRVNRPEGDDLNPFPEYKDLYNVYAGNPYLRPEKIHSIEFGWQYKQGKTTFILTPYYHYTFNKMTEITKVLDNGIVETTKENMSSSSEAGAEAVLHSILGHWCNFNLSSNLFYNTINASDLGYSSHKGAMAWYVSLNSDFTPVRNLMFQVNTRYNSSVLTPQGKNKGTYIMNLGAKYDIPKYDLAFTATVSDLFNSYKNVTIVDTPTIQQRLERRRTPRVFYFGISYKFGNGSSHHASKDWNYDQAL
jgi:outer membrane receptor protein involved in Fe transport